MYKMLWELSFLGFLIIVFIISYFFLGLKIAFMFVMILVILGIFLYGLLFLFHKILLKVMGGKYDKEKDESRKPEIFGTSEKRRDFGLRSYPERKSEFEATKHRPSIQPHSEESGRSEYAGNQQVKSPFEWNRKPQRRTKPNRYTPI